MEFENWFENEGELKISEANARPLVDGHKFEIGEYVFAENYGETYYATEEQWRDCDPRDLGYEGGLPEDCFYNNGNEYFTQYLVVAD